MTNRKELVDDLRVTNRFSSTHEAKLKTFHYRWDTVFHMLITSDTIFEPTSLNLPDGLVIRGSGITIDGNGASLSGAGATGNGITLENCDHVTLKNFNISRFYHGIYARSCKNLTIQNCTITQTAELPPNSAFLDIWRPATEPYGSGIFLWQVEDSIISGNDLQHQMNGLLSYHCGRLEIVNNVANYCSGFGFHLYGTSDCHIQGNYADFCCRYQPRENGRGHMGADAAGFLIVHGSSNNLFQNNFARMGGDGFFLAGLTPAGRHVPCNRNLFEENDGSYSPNIAFEATFSSGNIYRNNRANYCNYGFWLGFSRENELIGNEINGNRRAGIAVENGIDMRVSGNRIQQNEYGILLWSKYVPLFAKTVPENDTSRHWEIRDNRFVRNRCGIRIAAEQDHGVRPHTASRGKMAQPTDHKILSNRFAHNQIDIEQEETESSTVEENHFD